MFTKQINVNKHFKSFITFYFVVVYTQHWKLKVADMEPGVGSNYFLRVVARHENSYEFREIDRSCWIVVTEMSGALKRSCLVLC